jgi:hypothetical protein
MDWPDYLRDQANMYRQQAEQTDDPIVKDEFLELGLSVRKLPTISTII